MGASLWCRNCSKTRNHSGISGNSWQAKENGETVLRCTRCGHLRTRNITELEEGAVIQGTGIIRPKDETRTLARDGYLEAEDDNQ